MPRTQRATLIDTIRRQLDLDPPGTIDTVASEIVPVYIVGVLEPETIDLPCTGGLQRGPDAGQYSEVGLVNPANSGVLLLLEDLYYGAGASSIQCGLYRNENPSAAQGQSLYRDQTLAGFPVGQIGGEGVAAAGGTACGKYSARLDMINHIDMRGFIIEPGGDLTMVTAQTDKIMIATFMWRERAVR